jgi:hypothetical protein
VEIRCILFDGAYNKVSDMLIEKGLVKPKNPIPPRDEKSKILIPG